MKKVREVLLENLDHLVLPVHLENHQVTMLLHLPPCWDKEHPRDPILLVLMNLLECLALNCQMKTKRILSSELTRD